MLYCIMHVVCNVNIIMYALHRFLICDMLTLRRRWGRFLPQEKLCDVVKNFVLMLTKFPLWSVTK